MMTRDGNCAGKATTMLEKQLEALLSSATDAMLGFDQEGRITIWNQAASRMFGYSAGQAIGMDLHHLIIPERYHEKAGKCLDTFAKTGEGPLVGKRTECTARHKNGSEFPVELSISAFQHDGCWHATGILRDISTRKKTESLLLRRDKILGAVAAIAEIILRHARLDSCADEVLARLGTAAGVSRAYLFENHMDEKGRQLTSQRYEWVAPGITPQINADELQNFCWIDGGFGRWLELMQQNKPVYGLVREFPESEREMLMAQDILSLAVVPIFTDGHWWGFIGFDDCHDMRHWTKTEIDALIVAANITGSAIKRQKDQEELVESEEKFRALVETVNSAIFIFRGRKNLFINPAAETITGYSLDELLGMDFWEIMHPDFKDLVRERGLARQQGEDVPASYEVKIIRKNGEERWLNFSAARIEYEKKPAILGIAQDITDRKRSQIALQTSHEQVRASLIGTIVAISRAVGARDPYTAGHQQRVSQLSRAIAQEMGLDKERIDGLRMGASIHDIGKIYLPAEILSKPARLTTLEYELVKGHAQVGYDILREISFPWPIADIAHQHHERLDGSGYPQGLKGDEICLEARIVAVADVVEAMSSHRPYRPALGIDAARKEIRSNRGNLYDPDVVDACLNVLMKRDFHFADG
jgi:PAS domain S-box-containing protein/putative nucleotidyltransferase with HDIG domain